MININKTNNTIIDLSKHTDLYVYKIYNSKTVAIYFNKKAKPYIETEKITNGSHWYNYAPSNLQFFKYIKVKDFVINTGDILKVKLTSKYNYYSVNYIVRTKEGDFLIKTHIPNKTTTYLLPCLESGKKTFSCHDYMINAYIDESGKYINILYRYVSDDYYKTLELKLLKHKYYIDTIDISNEYIIHKFEIPEKYKEDVTLFIKGMYSKFSSVLKRRILEFHNKGKNSELYGILYKTSEYRKKLENSLNIDFDESWELDSRLDLNSEYYKNDLDKIVETSNEKIHNR